MKALRRSWISLLTLGLLAACASRQPAPVIERSPSPRLPAVQVPARPTVPETELRVETYTVKPGDTLHKIALDFGLDYRELAAWNNVENVNVIHVGQVLRLKAPGAATVSSETGVVTAPLKSVPPVGEAKSPLPAILPPARANTDAYKASPKAVKLPYSDQAYAQLMKTTPAAPIMVASAPASSIPTTPPVAPAPAAPASQPPTVVTPAPGGDADQEDRIDWSWPAVGKIVTTFNDGANLKGVDIAGKAGQPVIASAAGKVVYAGSGLRGYGKLVIIKHNKTYLSAYAHNSTILVKEGQQVTKGQKIAEMGNTDADAVKLHFEIRHLGKPVDPLKFLPPA